MENTLENEMLDAAISWCDSNGINVLAPEQLSHLVNSLYVTVCDSVLDTAQPGPVNAMLVEALEEARNGLAWYQAMYPGATDGSDDEAMERIEAALATAEHGASNAKVT